MYHVKLTESSFPAQSSLKLLEQTIGDTLRQAAEDSAEKTALIEMCADGSIGRRWTYGELYEQSLQLAYHLVAQYPKGTRIAVCAPNIPEWVILEYASTLAGLTLVTVNPSFQAREMSYVIEQSGAVALYLVQSCRGNPVAEFARQVQNEQPALVNLIDMQDSEEFLGHSAHPKPLPEVSPDDPVQIQYTSGTTGVPKGAVLHHRGLLNNALLVGDRMGIGARDTWMNFMPMFHTGGCGLGTLAALTVRARNILASKFDPSLVNLVIEQEKVSCFLAVPTMLVGLLEDLAITPRDHSSLRAIISGGAMVAPSLVEQVMKRWNCAVQVIYGQTECSPVVVQAWREDSFEDLTETAGQPLPHTEISIRDSVSNEVLPLNTVGELCARGYSVMYGYNDNPEATGATIDKNGWLHTGDLGYMDERGYIKITGRVKEMIIRGGENLFPVEIENAMLTHSSIAEVAVVGIPDEKWGEVVCCFIRLEDGIGALTVELLVAHARELLSPQKTPRYWVCVDEWPLTGSGKIQKFKLRERFEEEGYQPLRTS